MASEKRLIDANALKVRLGDLEASGGHKYYRQGMDDVLHKFMPQILDDSPAVDAVEVVRCYFCKHYNRIMGTCMVDRKLGQTTPQIRVKQDDFCSYGERKDNDTETDKNQSV